jgi:hypothetical protein
MGCFAIAQKRGYQKREDDEPGNERNPSRMKRTSDQEAADDEVQIYQRCLPEMSCLVASGASRGRFMLNLTPGRRSV